MAKSSLAMAPSKNTFRLYLKEKFLYPYLRDIHSLWGAE
jgi:hypothetical protein